ncbi:MAG: radical SAM family heme chaperone HemW [Deltaproteobacteria bacterium]|nr:radical SAM family heme chaperone HemW [Deltaproteobacteria bacterium]
MFVPLGIYIHFPFCIHRCVYCDFNVFLDEGPKAHATFIDLLEKEISHQSKRYSSRFKVDTIYCGGGTPSLFSPPLIQRVLNCLSDQFQLTQTCEITLEANPNSLNRENLEGFLKSGINRLSIGIQSLTQKHLKTLERSHTAQEALEAIALAQTVGFRNINLDFIFGIPGQTLLEWQETLLKAFSLNPQHLSTYHLTVPPRNRLFEQLPSDGLGKAMYQWAVRELPTQGFRHYEVSAFSQTGMECKHNLKYWKLENYLGLGPGADSYLITPEWPFGCHLSNIRNLKQYETAILTQNGALAESEILNQDQAQRDYLLTHFRLMEGISFQAFQDRFHLSFEDRYQKILQSLQEKMMVDIHKQMLKLTPKGLLYLNQVLIDFM